MTSHHKIVLFDGVCNLCNGAVRFIIRRDRRGQFRFASLQGETGSRLAQSCGAGTDLDSIILIDGDKVYTRSSAVLRICGKLRGAWPLLAVFLLVPRPIRDAAYNLAAANRYRLFGKRDACMVPRPEWKERFMDGL